MQARVAQYLNEIVSLSMLLALAAALIAGEAGAARPADTESAAPIVLLETVQEMGPLTGRLTIQKIDQVAEIDFSIRHQGE